MVNNGRINIRWKKIQFVKTPTTTSLVIVIVNPVLWTIGHQSTMLISKKIVKIDFCAYIFTTGLSEG